LNALASANMALAGYEHLIPLDEVILAMQEVGSGMDHKYRCTCKGGLSLTPTAQKVFQRLGRG
jgi:L-serine dehydratase